MRYNYNAGHNNGRVAQTVDGVLGETVNYTYDMWNRLTAASATNGNWGEQYTFDNFGNLTAKTPTAGSAPAMNWPGATNQTSGTSLYDADGNPFGYSNGSGPGYLWDVENHLAADQTAIYTPINYIYDPWGRRVWKQIGSGRDNYGNPQPYTGEVYFYGATGQKLETYSFTWESSFGGSLEGINIYFGGKLLQSKGVWVATDRLGSVRANSNGESMSYWPYGEERDSTANGREKFATYTRDGVGQDYAMARYYNSSTGAFWSPDPGGIATANSRNPGSWNRYTYVGGDPVNKTDRRGYCSDQDDPPCYGTTVTAEAPPDPLSGNGASTGTLATETAVGDRAGSDDDEGGGSGSMTSATQAKQGLIDAFDQSQFSNCAKVFGGTTGVDNYVNQMTFVDGTQPGSMGMAGSGSTQTFANYESQTGAFAVTLTNASGNNSSTVVLLANFFGNVAGGNPNPLVDQDVTLIHEFMHSMFNLDHGALAKKFGITVKKGESASDAMNDWIKNDCKNN